MKIKSILLIILLFLQGNLMSATIENISIKNVDIPVIYENSTNLPILDVQLVFKNSGYINDKNKPGLASLSANLLNEGTKKLGSTKFAKKLENNAISLSSSCGFETFVIELSSLKDVSDKATLFLKELLKDPNYNKNTLEKIKTIKIGTLKRLENDYDWVAKNELNKVFFKNTPLENQKIGTIASIKDISLKEIKNYIKNKLVLKNLIIVAGGDYKFKEFKKLIKPILKVLEIGENKELSSFNPTGLNETKILKKDTQQAYIYFGAPFNIAFNDKDNYKAKVASFILGGSGFGSRIMEEIRVKRGLAYSAYSNIIINKSNTYFSGYLQTKNESTKEAQNLIKNIVEDFIKNGATQDELNAAKNFILGSEPLRIETLSQRLNRSFNSYYKGFKLDYPKKELLLIQDLSLEDLNNYIKAHSEIKNLTFSIVRN